MKSLLGLLILITTATSFSYANTVRIGNGGDTQTDGVLDDNAIANATYTSARDTQLLLHAWQKNPPANLALTKQQQEALLTVIRATPVDIIGYDACSDGISKKDAVAYSTPAPKICVSSLQLKAKLTNANYKSQILALLLHEYSHLIGFDEASATQLQQYTLRFIEFYGYPVPPMDLSIDDYKLYDPYSIFRGLWKDKSRLMEDVAAYSSELREKMQKYSIYFIGNYPLAPLKMNYTGDILLRLNYLDLAIKAYWQTPPDKKLQKRLVEISGSDIFDILYFNNTDLNPTQLGFSKTDLGAPYIDDKKEENFKALIVQIDALKTEMETYMWTVLRPTPPFNYYPSSPKK
jgi:hypothetical protein